MTDMQNLNQLDRLIIRMMEFDSGDPKRIQHFTKVYEYAALIGRMQELDPKMQLTLETAAIVHDIGIHPAENRYGKSDGKLQEKEGPAYAQKMLAEAGFGQELITRVMFLVGHHHTYTAIDADDYQILVEADFLVNLYEDHADADAVLSAYHRIFRTTSGRRIFRNMFMTEYRVQRIEEPDFGCEGRPDGKTMLDQVLLTGADGSRKVIAAEDRYLYEKNINEGNSVYLIAGKLINKNEIE